MVTDELAALIQKAIEAARDAGEISVSDEAISITLEVPRNKQHGDYSSNIALALKKATGIANSRELADKILRYLPADPLIDRVEIAGPGFLNFYLKPSWLHDTLLTVEQEDARYGTTAARAGERILIEFVSANPTGPISVVNGRAAALGDVLANLLAAQGCEVGREFYVNDALNSTQLDIFARTVEFRYFELLGHPVHFPDAEGTPEPAERGMDAFDQKQPLHFPKDGYRGEYVKDIARQIVADEGARLTEWTDEERRAYFREATLKRMVNTQRVALEAFGINFDTWFYESSLYDSGEVDRTIERLRERGYTYEDGGALWLRSTALGDDKDRVLVRSTGKATYIAADSAYHADKFDRGYTHLINIWGADHHGYVARLKAGVAALGYCADDLEIVLTQMVSLVRDGEAVIGGKRKGNVIELKEDLVDDIGRDAARFYFLLNSYETPATVDVELARKQSNDNPVYYVQYAHARLCNIIRRSAELELALKPSKEVERHRLTHDAELDVLRKLADYPGEVSAAATGYAPHRLTRYAMELASLLNGFYENCRVIPGKEEPVEPELSVARLSLVNGARIVLGNLLHLLGISAPERM